jgi:hypothetical protein
LALTFVFSQVGSQSCKKEPLSEQEARDAVALFFSSNSEAARSLIARLRGEGMSNEYLDLIKNGCRDCYVHRGTWIEEDSGWYLIAALAPPESKKSVVFKVGCSTNVWIDHRLYGG